MKMEMAAGLVNRSRRHSVFFHTDGSGFPREDHRRTAMSFASGLCPCFRSWVRERGGCMMGVGGHLLYGLYGLSRSQHHLNSLP